MNKNSFSFKLDGIKQSLELKADNRIVNTDFFDVTYTNEEVVIVESQRVFFRVYCTLPAFKFKGESVSNYEALIIPINNNEVIINLRMKRSVFYFLIVWVMFVAFIIILSFKHDDFAWIFYFLFMISPIYYYRRQKKYFKILLLTFSKK